MSENKISVEAELFVGMILAAKLGKKAGEDLRFECLARTGSRFIFKSVEAIGGDWLRLSLPDKNDCHIKASTVSEWNEVESVESELGKQLLKQIQQAQQQSQNQKWNTKGHGYTDSSSALGQPFYLCQSNTNT